MRVAVLGASGFIGKHLQTALEARGDSVVTASLRNPREAAQRAAGANAIVNLAGAPIAQRWNTRVKSEIETSRTQLPRQFLDALAQQRPAHAASTPFPSAYVSASAIGYYGTSETMTFTETSPPGNDFLANVCEGWEAQAHYAETLGMRVVCIRNALVLGSDGGALQKILPIFKLGAGGIVGSGRQWYSWIHIDDLIAIYLMALDTASINGALNASSPNPVTNAEFTKTLGEVVHRLTVLPAPTFAIRAALGEGAVVLLEGQRVLPERTQALGFAFHYPNLKPALENLVSSS